MHKSSGAGHARSGRCGCVCRDGRLVVVRFSGCVPLTRSPYMQSPDPGVVRAVGVCMCVVYVCVCVWVCERGCVLKPYSCCGTVKLFCLRRFVSGERCASQCLSRVLLTPCSYGRTTRLHTAIGRRVASLYRRQSVNREGCVSSCDTAAVGDCACSQAASLT